MCQKGKWAACRHSCYCPQSVLFLKHLILRARPHYECCITAWQQDTLEDSVRTCCPAERCPSNKTTSSPVSPGQLPAKSLHTAPPSACCSSLFVPAQACMNVLMMFARGPQHAVTMPEHRQCPAGSNRGHEQLLVAPAKACMQHP